MTASEAAREEWRKLKDKPLKDKLIHIGTYYWPYIVTAAFLLILAGSLISSFFSAKDSALYAYLLSTVQNEEGAENTELTFADFAGIDTESHSVTITASSYSVSGSTDMNLADSQIIASQTAAEALDLLAGDTAALLNYAYNDYFFDLRDILTPEQLEKWTPYLLYIDRQVSDTIAEGIETSYVLPDPAKPEEMEEPIPVALSIPAESILWDDYSFLGEKPAVGIIVNTQQPENAVLFLEFILQ